MTKKKWLYLVLIVVLVVPVLFFYNAFNGNPISKFIAAKSVENYLSKTYPTDEFNVDKPFYDFKMGGYSFDVNKIGEEAESKYEFIMTGVLGTNVSWDGIYEANQDRPLIEKLSKQANEELLGVLEEKTPEVKEVDVQLEILKGHYDRDTNWDKDFTPEKPMYIYITIDAENLNPKDVLQKTNDIQKILNEANYDYEDATINANIFNAEESKEESEVWYVKYATSFSKDTVLKIKDVEEFNN